MSFERLEELERQLRPEAWRALLGALLLLTLLAAYLYVLKPTLAHYRELARGWSPDAVASSEDRAASTSAEIERLERELVALDERIYGGPSRLPREQIESHVIDRLDRLSASRDVRLESVKPGDAGEILGFEELPYDVNVAGDYFALFDWLEAVEDELRPMVVKRFEMAPAARSDRVGMKLRLVSYRPREGRS
jgi:Tfp pilus assembly protein PilO